MRFEKKNYYSTKTPADLYTVAQAFEYELSDNDGGAIECVERECRKQREAFARLMQVLSDKGLLNDEAVATVLDAYSFTPIPDDIMS